MMQFFTERYFQALITVTVIIINCRIMLVLYDLNRLIKGTNYGFNIMEGKNIFSKFTLQTQTERI